MIIKLLIKSIRKYRASVAYQKLDNLYEKYIASGDIKKFDDEFYKQFDGMFFDGIPVYYYLQKMNMKRCYDASAVLALAMNDGCYVCRGDLKGVGDTYEKREQWGHGWVEKDGKVYDTTWQIICDKEIYYEVFKPRKVSRTKDKLFFEQCKGIADWTIRDKEYYENNWDFANLTVFQIREIEKLILNSSYSTKEEKEFAKKVLEDLPDENKLQILHPDL